MRERKPLDPALKTYLDQQAGLSGNMEQMPDGDRARLARSSMMLSLRSRASIPGLPNGVSIRDVFATPTLAIRLYTPPLPSGTLGRDALPLLVYLHGGGWVAGSIATGDPFCRLLSENAGIVIASVEYRLAPEHPYPAALDDALSAVGWALAKASSFGCDPKRIAIGGDSAGGNLAAVTANRICAANESPTLMAQLLLYPVIDHPRAGHPSYSENATGFGLDANAMRWFWQQYAPGMEPDDPAVAPLHIQHLPSLPPTLVATAEYDVLRDEAIAYAQKLAAAGVPVTHIHAPDMHHNFPVSSGTVARFPQSTAALTEIAAWLRATLHRSTAE